MDNAATLFPDDSLAFSSNNPYAYLTPIRPIDIRRYTFANQTRNNLEDQFSDFGELTVDEQLIVHYMYNSGERMTTAKVIELTGRSRSFVVKMLHKLRDLEIITWFGSSKNDRNQYYLLVDR